MNLAQIENLSDTNTILRGLRSEAREEILRDLEAVVFSHRAKELAGEVKGRLADSRKEVKALEKRKAAAEKELNTLQDQLIGLQQQRIAAVDQRARIVAGYAEGDKPNVNALDERIRKLERGPLSEARGEARTAHNKLLEKQAELRGLESLLQALPTSGKPATPALDLIHRHSRSVHFTSAAGAGGGNCGPPAPPEVANRI